MVGQSARQHAGWIVPAARSLTLDNDLAGVNIDRAAVTCAIGVGGDLCQAAHVQPIDANDPNASTGSGRTAVGTARVGKDAGNPGRAARKQCHVATLGIDDDIASNTRAQCRAEYLGATKQREMFRLDIDECWRAVKEGV